MSILDIILLLIFVVSIIYGFRKGMIVQIGAVGGVIVGILACRLFGPWLTGVFTSSDADANDIYICGVFANVLLFLIGYICARLVASLIKTVTHGLHLSIIDRLAGALFSLFEWMLVASIALNLWQAFRPELDVTKNSKLADGRAAAAVMDLAPKVFGSETARDFLDAVSSVGH